VVATLRLSKLHKDTAVECNNKLIGRTGLDVDVKRATVELGFCLGVRMRFSVTIVDARNQMASIRYVCISAFACRLLHAQIVRPPIGNAARSLCV